MANQTQILKHLQQHTLFSGMSDEVLHELATQAIERDIGVGKTVLQQGEAGDTLYLVVQGRLHASIQSGEGKPLVVGEINTGEPFGEK